MKRTITLLLVLLTATLIFTSQVPTFRIINGSTATLGQFPFAVNLNVKVPNQTNVYVVCGASLIGNQWIVTAAHCVNSLGDITAYLGSINATTRQKTVTVPNSNSIVHPDWKSPNIQNDIALVKIPFVSYTDRIKPIILPAYSSPLQNYNNAQGTIIGWGTTSSGNLATNLQYASVKVLSQEECSQKLNIVDSIICTSSLPSSICGGDSGGPLVANGVLVGITSFTVNGCTSGMPNGFTRVTSFLWFIKNNTGIAY